MEIIWRVISREGKGGEWGKGTGFKKHNLVGTKYTGEVKNSIGNGEAKELICMTHGHELRRGITGGKTGTWWREQTGKIGITVIT